MLLIPGRSYSHLSQMSTRVFCCILILHASFSPVTQNFTAQTPLITDLNEYLFNLTSNQPASTIQTHATFTDATLVQTTDAGEDITDPTATPAKNITLNVTDQSVASTDLTKYPFTSTAKPPLTTNQSELTTTAELRTKSNSSDQISPSALFATAKPNASFTDGPTFTVQHTDVTTQSNTNPSDCLCDVTPEFCDIGCCCDVMDCGLLNLSSVFNGCRQDTESGVCVESWLMFKTSINPALVTLTGNLFCVQKEEDSDVQSSLALSQSSYVHPLLLKEPTAIKSQTNFYKVDDIILTYYNSTSAVSALRQPSPGPASSACVSRNPARFLRSGSLACSRLVTGRSCVEDRSFSAATYYTGFSLLRVPEAQMEDRPELLIPISTARDWPEPRQQNGLCLNVVSKVEYGIEFTGNGEIVKITLNAELINTTVNTQLLQNHIVSFQLVTPTPSVATPTPQSYPQGIKPGSPVIGWFGEEAKPITLLGSSGNGDCSARLDRLPVLFGQNSITGCTFRSLAGECGALKAELMEVLTATAVPELMSMTTGAQSERSQVITEDCPTPATQEGCETGCMLPTSLSVQVLWAQRGLRVLPQNHILGAKFIFSCQRLKCPLRSSIPVTTQVVFSDSTVYPEIPRGDPQPQWKFPFDFFSRGAGEFDQE